MEQLTLDGLKALAQQEGTPKVSLYMPMYKLGPDIQQNPTRYRNMLADIENALRDREMSGSDIDSLLEPARAFQEDSEFWEQPADGMVVFLAPGVFEAYRLPFEVDEKLIVSPQFSFTPVMRLFTTNGRFYILAVSQKQVRLFGANQFDVWPIELPESLPTSREAALQIDQFQMEARSHGNAGGSGGVGGPGAGPVFGGGEEDDNKELIRRYLNILDAGIRSFLRDQHVPMVLAAVDYLHPIYHDQSEYQTLMDDGIIGNPEMLRPEELHERAWPIVEPVFRQSIEQAKEVYGNLSATERSSKDLREITGAAVWARVDTLFTAQDAEEWGTFDPASAKVVIRREGPRTYEDLPLIDFAVTHTLLNGGQVFALTREDMPVEAPVAAIYRWEQEK